MKAARLVGPRQFEILDVDTPTPKAGEVLVRMEYASICGSDLLTYDRVLPEEDYPLRVGLPCHETSGIVEESMDESLKKGDRVVALTYTGGLMEYTTIAANRCILVPPSVVPARRGSTDGCSAVRMRAAGPCAGSVGRWSASAANEGGS